MIRMLVQEAVQAGARQEKACELLGVSVRTLERYQKEGAEEDRRQGPVGSPKNALSALERQRLLALANSPEFRELSPKQLVPRLADQGQYVASESTFYRVLKQAEQLKHRRDSRPATHARPKEHVAEAPNRVWSWDITYLRSPVRGRFYYLYLIVDVFSRKIMGWDVHEEESAAHASQLIAESCARHGVDATGLVLHSDNGGPMKGSTMLSTLQRLGVVPSFSRPGVSDDNPYSEALFRTLKYRPGYPSSPFESLEAALLWVEGFVGWYNTEHRHSALRFVTPNQRHSGQERQLLAERDALYQQARQRNPHRWKGNTRCWEPAGPVRLNPRIAAQREPEEKAA